MNERTEQDGGDAAGAAAATLHAAAAVSRGLKGAGSAIEKMVQAAAGSNDLTLAHWLILVQLSRAETCRQGELHAETGVNAGYLTRLLDELEARRLLGRRRSSEDRRQILLSLTDAGRRAARSMLASIDHHRLLEALEELKSSLDNFLSNSTGSQHP
jgi:DNA-binding MarR family transcriptional regulator